MHHLRRFFRSHRAIAVLVIALALAMKVIVPAGFMPTDVDGQIVVGVCSGSGSTTMVVTIPGMKHGDDGEHDGGDKHGQPCAFSGLSMPGLAGTDPLVLALAILFVMATGLRSVAAIRPATPDFLRPPLRAPPTTA